jgi:ribosomal protein L29
MDSNEIRLWISRILSGTAVKNRKEYQIPTLNEASEILYQEVFSEAIFLGCMTQEECEELTNPVNIEPLHEKVNKLKIELFNLRNKPEAAQNIRNQLRAAKSEIIRASQNNSRYYQYSAEYIACYARDYCEIEIDRPTELQIREIARSGIWYSMWSAAKLRLFPRKLTEDQIALIGWTNKYISIMRSPDRPETWVLDDDDMLDGWLLSTTKEEKRPQIQGDGDIFMFVKTPGEAQKVFEMNDMMGQAIIQGRMKHIDKRGTVNEQELPDVKRDLQMERNRARQ